MRQLLLLAASACFACPCLTSAQQSFFSKYQERIRQTTAGEPHWVTPLFTTSPRIEQGFRADFVRRSLSGGKQSRNLGNANGLQFIPLRRLEIRISPPPFFLYTDPRISQGFGDPAFRVKYLLYGSNEDHHNAIATVSLAASIPTGKNTNGSCCAVLTPTLYLGKGFGKSAFESTIGGSLPVSNTKSSGRQILWNNALQYRLTRYLGSKTSSTPPSSRAVATTARFRPSPRPASSLVASPSAITKLAAPPACP